MYCLRPLKPCQCCARLDCPTIQVHWVNLQDVAAHDPAAANVKTMDDLKAYLAELTSDLRNGGSRDIPFYGKPYRVSNDAQVPVSGPEPDDEGGDRYAGPRVRA